MEKPSPELLAEITKFRTRFDAIRKNIYDGIEELTKMLAETKISPYLKSERRRIVSVNSKVFVILESIEANLNFWEHDKWIIEKEHIEVKIVKEKDE